MCAMINHEVLVVGVLSLTRKRAPRLRPIRLVSNGLKALLKPTLQKTHVPEVTKGRKVGQ